MTNTGEFVPKPMSLPPLPRLNIPEQIEDQVIAGTPKIDLTPIDAPKVDDKPTEEQIGSFKPLLWVGLFTLGLIGFSMLQGRKEISTEIRTPNAETQAATVAGNEEVKPVAVAPPRALPMPERDPDKVQLNLLLLSHLNNAKNTQDQLVEARASWYRLQAQQLSQRNPQSYPMYLAGQLERVNLGLSNQVKLNQTTLVGTEEQTRIASALLIDAQAIALEQIRWKVANGEMVDLPDELRSRLMPSATSPYIQIAVLARDSDNIAYLNKLNLLADREQEEKRVAALESRRLESAASKKVQLPMPKEAKK
jgi:hypothetical protein